MGVLGMINYIKCSNGSEIIGIFSNNNTTFQQYEADGTEMIKI